MKLMVDLCSGTRSASISMRQHGWKVISVDYDDSFIADIIADVRELKATDITNDRPLLVWASPPCDDFAREFMPWSKTGKHPDMSIYASCKRLIEELNPIYYVIENVVGAQKYFGKANQHVGPFYLWTNLPPMSRQIKYRKKESRSSNDHIGRAAIPEIISERVRGTIDQTIMLPYPGGSI